jgi:hypothetical protein
MKYCISVLIFGLSFMTLISCGGQDGKSGTGGTNSAAVSDAQNSAAAGTTYYCWVDNANLRENPTLDGKVITQIKQGDAVTALGPVTKELLKIVLREVEFNEPWLQVKTADGKTGWVNKSVLVTEQVSSALSKGVILIYCHSSLMNETSKDWAWFTDTVFQVAKAYGLEAEFADEKLLKKPLLIGGDPKHPSLGVNLSKFIKDGGFDQGYIFYKPGKAPSFQDHDMVGPVLKSASKYFGMELSEDSLNGD